MIFLFQQARVPFADWMYSLNIEETLTPRMRIFFPTATDAVRNFMRDRGRFIYYSTADTVAKIVDNNEIWMRQTLVMNDVAEVDYGLGLLARSMQGNLGHELGLAVDKIFPGVFDQEWRSFASYAPALRYDSFVACISEFDAKAYPDGQLSMWRAYGGTSGVALVLNPEVVVRPSHALSIYSSPVAYLDEAEFAAQIERVIASIQNNAAEIKAMGEPEVRGALFNAFRFAALCTKHPAFKEEGEWRLIASEVMHPPVKLPVEVVSIGNTPQSVIKIPLKDRPEEGLVGLEADKFINEIVIGPCEHPDVIYRALHKLLRNRGLERLAGRIRRTNIPLRPNQR